MRYRIHFTLPDGTEDSVVISGGSIEAIQKRAEEEIGKRNAHSYWSEELS